MNIRPIPAELLPDSFTLLTPTSGGDSSEQEIRCVRVMREQRTELRSDRMRHLVSVLTAYYDCVQSEPSGAEFPVGAHILYGGKRYEITRVQEFGVSCLHHIRITAEGTEINEEDEI